SGGGLTSASRECVARGGRGNLEVLAGDTVPTAGTARPSGQDEMIQVRSSAQLVVFLEVPRGVDAELAVCVDVVVRARQAFARQVDQFRGAALEPFVVFVADVLA